MPWNHGLEKDAVSFNTYEAVIQCLLAVHSEPMRRSFNTYGKTDGKPLCFPLINGGCLGGCGQAKKTPLQAACLYAVAAVMSWCCYVVHMLQPIELAVICRSPRACRWDWNYSFQRSFAASEGMRQSPRGDSDTLPTFGPSGRHERLNCCWKNLRRKMFSQWRMVSSS